MKKRLPLLCCLFGLCLLSLQYGFAQAETPDTARLWRIATVDDNEYFGRILSRDSEQIVLQTENIGLITIRMQNIKSIREANPARMVNGAYWAENPQATRYFWGPNGYGLAQGEGYYQNVWVLFNQVSIGLSDNVSLGVGMVPLFLFSGTATPIWFTPKVSIPIKKDAFNLGGGMFIGTVIGEESGAFGIAYGVATVGSRDKNLSVGLGYGFVDGDWARRPAVSINGMLRIGKKGYLLGESYLFNEGGVILLGGRTVWNKLSLDYGLGVPFATGGFFAAPWLGLVLPFGNTRTTP